MYKRKNHTTILPCKIKFLEFENKRYGLFLFLDIRRFQDGHILLKTDILFQ